jgi:hypothetical protein
MDEINVLMSQFQVAIKMAIEAEVKRQISGTVGAITLDDATAVRTRKPYAKSPPKPCPTCGVPNTARRFRYHCQEHRP